MGKRLTDISQTGYPNDNRHRGQCSSSLVTKHRLKPQWDFKIYPPKLAKIKNSHKTMR